MTADQSIAFQANGGFLPAEVSAVILAFVFAILLLWGAWALRSAYAGWAEQHFSQGQFLGVAARFVALYLALAYFLLS
jgi:integrating conjugative element protein (TIGR03758 family)